VTTAARRLRWPHAAAGLVLALVLGAALATWALRPGTEPAGPVGDPGTPAAEPASNPSDERATCEGAEHGVTYRIRYPADWWASDGEDGAPCRWFHPQRLDFPDEPRDVPEVAIMVRIVDHSFAEARHLDPEHYEVHSEEARTVDGRRALVQEYGLRGDELYPEGTRISRHLVDVDGRTLHGATADAVAQADYDESRAVLAEIMRHLEVMEVSTPDDAHASCSAADHRGEPEPQEGLPPAVAETRAAIVAAAAACDIDRLVELAADPFTYSFGDGGAFGDFLRRQEAAGRQPLHHLVELLDRPVGTVEVEGRMQYVWPSAFAADDWDAVSEADREALKPLYDEEDFASFAEFGGYLGYRVGIEADGRWVFFVAGD
jgi:hypothetical protein